MGSSAPGGSVADVTESNSTGIAGGMPHFPAVARHEQRDMVGRLVGPVLGHEPPHLVLSTVEMLEPDIGEHDRGRLVRRVHFIGEAVGLQS